MPRDKLACPGYTNNEEMIVICGRYTVFTESEIIEMRAILNEIDRKFGEDAVSVGEIFPTNTAPILTMEGNQLTPVPVFWGFPKWDGSKGVLINALPTTPQFIEYEAVYLPKNQFIKDETMTTKDY
jgi:putative SOS response-associated peptidase YedK